LREVFPFDEAALDRLFDTPADKFGDALLKEAKDFYAGREGAFGAENLRKVERDIYLQVLDNLWMQHLENMDHLREGIHWMSVGQRDPLVEYRRQGQLLFEDMQTGLRHDVVRALFHAEPVSEQSLERPVDTELTRAARQSVANADRILENEVEFEASDFVPRKVEATTHRQSDQQRKKARKAERQRRQKGRKRR